MKKRSVLSKKGVAAVLSAAMVLGGTINVQAATIKDVFDAQYYSQTYSDLAEAFGEDAGALYNHYLTFGQKEGRVVVPYIDLVKYKEAYEDLRLAFGDDWNAYLQHYLTYGVKEGRQSFGKDFDARYYADSYPDLKEAFGYDVVALYKHWVQFGKNEGRSAMPAVSKAGTSSSSSSKPGTDKPVEKKLTVQGNLSKAKVGDKTIQEILAAEGDVWVVFNSKTAKAAGMSLCAWDRWPVRLKSDGTFVAKLPVGSYTITVDVMAKGETSYTSYVLPGVEITITAAEVESGEVNQKTFTALNPEKPVELEPVNPENPENPENPDNKPSDGDSGDNSGDNSGNKPSDGDSGNKPSDGDSGNKPSDGDNN